MFRNALLVFGSTWLTLGSAIAAATPVVLPEGVPAAESAEERTAASPAGQGAKTVREDWYLYWGFGAGAAVYPRTAQSIVDRREGVGSGGGKPSLATAIDVPGIYFPVPRRNSIAGFAGSVSTKYELSNARYVDLDQYQASVSFMDFRGPQIGEGFYWRADLGASWLRVYEYSSSFKEWYAGFGGLGGLGYGMALSEGTRVLLQAAVAYRRFPDGGATTASMTVGLLF